MGELMNTLAAWVAFVAGLSVATERITEIIKGLFPALALEKEPAKPVDTQRVTAPSEAERARLEKDKRQVVVREEKRKVVIQLLAILVGAALAYVTYGQIQGPLKLPDDGLSRIGVSVVFGAMASGGSGMWNSALDILREVNKQKQVLTERLKGR